MLKTIALLKCKTGMSRQDFIDYYESRHAPLIRKLLPQLVEYRRNFIEPEGVFISPGAAPVDFDVITEMWFQDRAAYDQAMAKVAEPEVWDTIAADEENLFDRGKTRMFVVEEQRSKFA